jgi:DNA-binding NarL/FixJ family response regulator
MIRVVVADDHAVVRRGLEELLNAEADIEVVGTARDGAEAHGLLSTLRPDVFLMDLSMPGVDGIEATRFAGLGRLSSSMDTSIHDDC